jgi:glutathione synthase
MDGVETVVFDKDTSFAFMLAATALGHRVYHAKPIDLFQRGREVFANARAAEVGPERLDLKDSETLNLSEIEAVMVRKDPPFDTAYLHLTQQLDLVKSQTLVVNDPAGLRAANEKLFAFHFSDLMPRSMVSAEPERIRAFVDEVGGRAVLKPLDGAGGSGVVSLASDDRNTRALIDLLTHEGKEAALVQEYVPDVRTGDKRILLLDGEPLGAILRVPREDDIRANIHVGGRVEPTRLTPAETALVEQVAPSLREHGLWFVGLDVIGERLIEVNVTSPTGIQELSRFEGTKPETRVMQWVVSRAAELQ